MWYFITAMIAFWAGYGTATLMVAGSDKREECNVPSSKNEK